MVINVFRLLTLVNCTFESIFKKFKMFRFFIAVVLVFSFSACLNESPKESDADSEKYKYKEVVFKDVLPPDTIKLKQSEFRQERIKDSDWELLNKEEIEYRSYREVEPAVQTQRMELVKAPRRQAYSETRLSYSVSSTPIDEIKPQTVLPMRKLSNTPLNLQYLNEEQGLPSGSIQFIYEDKSGNLWMAIEVIGLVKYNGRNAWLYNVNEGLCSNFIYSCTEDRNGNMFIGTRHGLNIFNGKEIKLVTFNGLNRAVTAVTKRKNGDLLFCLSTGEIICYDGVNFKQEFNIKSYIDDFVIKIYEDTKGNLWLSTSQNGLLLKQGGELFTFTALMDQIRVEVSSIFEEASGKMWLGRKDGVMVCIDGPKIVKYTIPLAFNGQITSIVQDSEGDLWFAVYGKGVVKYNNSKFYAVNANDDLLSNRVNHLLRDKTGNIWFSTITDGIIKYTENGISNLFGYHANKGQFVYSVAEDRKNKTLWYGLYDFGLVRYDGTNYYRLNNDRLLNAMIYTLYCDKRGRLWVAVYGGVIRIEGAIATYFLASDDIYLNEPTTITEDHSGHIWVGTYGGGVLKFDDTRLIYYGEEHGLSTYYVSSIIETKDNTMWVGFYNGEVTKIKDGKISTIKFFETKGHKQISALCEIDSGIVLAATDHNGLFAIKGTKLRNYSTSNGLSSNSILSVLWDKSKKRVFLATNEGLNIAQFDSGNLKDWEGNLLVKTVLNKDDGLASNDFIERGTYISGNRTAYWGNGKGLMKLNLNDFVLKNKEPVLSLVGLDINGKYINYLNSNQQPKAINGFSFVRIDSLNNMPRDIELPYHLNHLTFRFNAIDWTAPNKIAYQYMITGIDSDWSNSGSENYADYRNIPPGDYTFKVRAMGNNRTWGKTLEFHFVIFPPFWQTWWFGTIVIVWIIVVVYLLFRWRINVIKRKQHQFSGRLIKTQEDERTRISRELHDSVGQQLMLLNIKSNNTLQEEILPIIEEVRALSRNLAPINIDKVGLNKLITELVENVSSKTDLFFSNDTDGIDSISDLDTKLNLFRIIQEGTNNIIRHSKAKNARITFETKNGFHILTIMDDGIGFNVKSDQINRSVGLVSLKERAEIINGVLRIQSTTNGTKIEIKFPEK